MLLGLFFLLGIIQPFYSLSKILLYGKLFDFGYYLRAVGNLFSGINPYFAENFVYPPPVLFLFIPFYQLSFFWSQILWTLLSLICLIVAIKYSFKSLYWKPTKKQFLLIVPLVFLSFPVKWTFGLGQINHLVLLFLVLTYYFCQNKKDFWSGVCLGIAAILKLTPLFLLFYFLIKRKFKIVLVSAGTVVLLFLFFGGIFGFELMKDYLMTVIPRLFEPTTKHGYYNQAFSSLSAGFVSNAQSLNFLNFLFASMIIFFDTIIFKRIKNVNSLDYSLAISSMLLINGFSWQHHFSLLLFPFLVIFNYLTNKKSQKLTILSFVAYGLVAFNIKHPELLGNSFLVKILLQHVFWGNLLLWFLLLMGIIRDQRLRSSRYRRKVF